MKYQNDSRYYIKTKLQANNLIFGYFYNVQKLWQRYLYCIIASIGIALVYWCFIQYSGIYSSGLSAISQGLSRLSQVLILANNRAHESLAQVVSNVLFWTLFMVMNIPLIVFSYFKIGKNFTKITTISFIVADLVGLGLGFIPNADKITQIFGTTTSSVQHLQKYGVTILFWTYDVADQIYDLVRVVSLFLYGLMSALIIPFIYSIIYILGASTGGTDFVSYYYAVKKRKPLGLSVTIFNTSSLILGTILGSYLAASLAPQPTSNGSAAISSWSLGLFLSPNLVASIISSMIAGVIIDVLFPKTKMAKIKIYSKKIMHITNHLLTNNYPHTFTIYQSIGAFSKRVNYNAETLCQFIEVPHLLNLINEQDSDSLVYVQVLNRMQGVMNLLEKID